jgi:hypothetical protein
MPAIARDPATGRPIHGNEEAIETLSVTELDAALTVAAHDPVRHDQRYDRLWRELLSRRRGSRQFGSVPHA